MSRNFDSPIEIGFCGAVPMTDNLSCDEIIEWLEDRARNCRRIAALKDGKDAEGWLDDARYLDAAIGFVQAAKGGAK